MSNYHGCKEEVPNKLNTTLFDRYYLQNCKAFTFRKITNHAKSKQTNVPSHLHIFWSNFDIVEQIIAFSTPSVLGETDFSTWCFEWGSGAWVKMYRFNAFSRNVNTTTWKIFPTQVGIYKAEKIQQTFWRYKTLRSLKKYERMYPLRLILKDKGGKKYCLPICLF